MSNYVYTNGELHSVDELKHSFSKQGHKYVFKEKAPDGTWRYYYKKEEIKGPRGNDRYSGSKYGTYVDENGKNPMTLKKVKNESDDIKQKSNHLYNAIRVIGKTPLIPVKDTDIQTVNGIPVKQYNGLWEKDNREYVKQELTKHKKSKEKAKKKIEKWLKG